MIESPLSVYHHWHHHHQQQQRQQQQQQYHRHHNYHHNRRNTNLHQKSSQLLSSSLSSSSSSSPLLPSSSSYFLHKQLHKNVHCFTFIYFSGYARPAFFHTKWLFSSCFVTKKIILLESNKFLLRIIGRHLLHAIHHCQRSIWLLHCFHLSG